MAEEITSELGLYRSRGYKDYSLGHQKMYTGPVELLTNEKQRFRVLDVGTGIGFGLRRMVDANVLESYVGIEANRETFDYVSGLPWPAHVKIHFGSWLDLPDDALEPADYGFCIEVIEHIEEPLVAPFLAKLRRNVKRNLFLSTPDIRETTHGTATADEWRVRIKAAGFSEVAIVGSQWTTLFVCE